MWKQQFKSINLTDVFFGMLINSFLCCSVVYVKKLIHLFLYLYTKVHLLHMHLCMVSDFKDNYLKNSSKQSTQKTFFEKAGLKKFEKISHKVRCVWSREITRKCKPMSQ